MDPFTKDYKLALAKQLYLQSPSGLSDSELAQQLGINRATAHMYRLELGAIKANKGGYTIKLMDEREQTDLFNPARKLKKRDSDCVNLNSVDH